MIHEATITYVTIDDKGNDKNVKENFVVDGLGCFAEVEYRLVDYFSSLTGLDVVAIKRSKVKEIANTRQEDDDKLFLAELMDTFDADDGTTKELKYKILVFSKTFDTAKAFITEYCKQGYNMELVSLKLTKFVDVIR